MAKIKYNVKGVERGGRDFEQPKPGLYEMEIKEANPRTEDGKNDIELVLEVTKGNDEFVGSRVWTYIGLGENTQWKLAELTDALGMPEDGTIDTDKLIGKKMKVKINPDSWNGEYRARVGRLAPLTAEAKDAEDETEDEAAEAEAEAAEFATIERNNVELSNDPSYYDDWTTDDLKEEVENQGLEIAGRFGKQKVIDALVALVNDEVGGGGAAEEEAEGDEYDDTDVWSDKDIAAEVKKRELTVTGKRNRATFIAALRADDAGEGGGDDDDPFAD